jgi:hypothetical protein
MGLTDTLHLIEMDLKGASDSLTQRSQESAMDLKGASDALTQMSPMSEMDLKGASDALTFDLI